MSRPEEPTKRHITSASGKARHIQHDTRHAPPRKFTSNESVTMKIQFKSPRLSLAFGLLLITAAPGNCFYNPNAGRWLSRDPLQQTGNPYLFCENDPLSGVDPYGLSSANGVVMQQLADAGTKTLPCEMGQGPTFLTRSPGLAVSQGESERSTAAFLGG
jgi:RHS repeat-associated protein